MAVESSPLGEDPLQVVAEHRLAQRDRPLFPPALRDDEIAGQQSTAPTISLTFERHATMMPIHFCWFVLPSFRRGDWGRQTVRHLWALSTAIAVLIAATIMLLGSRTSTLSGFVGGDDIEELPPARLAARGEDVPRRIACRAKPIQIQPESLARNDVTEDDLLVLLCNALPLWNPPSVPTLFHELKLCGRHARFDADLWGIEWTGESCLATLLHDDLCRDRTVRIGGTYLLDSPYGIRVVLLGGEDAVEYRGEAHFGQLLMILAEVGANSSTPVVAESGRTGTVADLYQDCVMRFSLAQELEFVACALACWHPPATDWENEFGEEFTFDDLTLKLVQYRLGEGSCGGCHVLYAIATILRVDEKQQLLSERVRTIALNRLYTTAELLDRQQLSSGGWDRTWGEEAPLTFIYGDDRLDRITITGHHLEWIALSPEAVRPASSTIRRAVAALRRDVISLPPLADRSFKTLLPVSHAARALALLRGDDPFALWMAAWEKGRVVRTKDGFGLRGIEAPEAAAQPVSTRTRLSTRNVRVVSRFQSH